MNKKLLIIDDDLPFRTRLSTSMEKKGFSVESYGEFKKSLTRITEKNFNIHVSGHAKKEELSLIINLIKPHLYLPIHGDHRMLQANANIAKENGIEEKNIFVLDDGKQTFGKSKTKSTG